MANGSAKSVGRGLRGYGNRVRGPQAKAKDLTVADIFPPPKQRPALLTFSKACGTRASALRRDECGDWAIFGKHGHIYAVPEGFQLMIGCDTMDSAFSKLEWTWAKKRPNFGKG
jgi:hypothetical protein